VDPRTSVAQSRALWHDVTGSEKTVQATRGAPKLQTMSRRRTVGERPFEAEVCQ
jgi:hypothetical protein